VTPAASATASISSALVAMKSSFGWVLMLFTPTLGAETDSAARAAEHDHVTDSNRRCSSTYVVADATT
jgi:hypothetical protein